MTDLKVYQIGLGNFGRHGFEKFVEMHNHLESVDVEFAGLVESDFEKREAAKKFAARNDIELEVFSSIKEFYSQASGDDVLVYDASPSRKHAENIYSSVNHGFFHLAEKPPSMTRDEHIRERKLAADKDVFWNVDFIERESPVVKKAVEILKGEEIDSIEIFRESSVGVQKLLNPVKRSGVVGGDILDKMTHEIFLFDLLDVADHNQDFKFQKGSAGFFMPKAISSDRMMNIFGGATRDMDEQTATGMTWAKFSSGDVDIELHSSWLGCSDEAREWDRKIEPALIDSNFRVENEKGFSNEETRFFVVQGSKNILGDLLNGRLIDLDSGELIQTPDLMHDQLYRVLRRAVEHAAEHRESNPDKEEIDSFMNGIFDARKYVTEHASEFFEELQKSNGRVKRMTAEGNIIEDSETDTVTG